jgi:hypothetical protein
LPKTRHQPRAGRRELAGGVDEFVDMLATELEPYREPAIFIQHRELAIGHSFVDSVRDALRRSRLLLPIVTPTYFRSSWTVAEYETFVARERITGADELVVPVLLRGGDDLPRDMQRRQFLDARRYPISGRLRSDRNAARTIRDVVEGIVWMLDRVPPYSADFPVVDPAEVRLPQLAEKPSLRIRPE